MQARVYASRVCRAGTTHAGSGGLWARVAVGGAAFWLLWVCVQPAGGILVGPEEAGCPACWSKVTLVRLVSYGSYVFDEPPKYDLVYRPQTREDYIACCPHCG